MNKHVHDPSRNVDRPPSYEERVGNRELDRDAQRDRKMQENVDATVEDSFPASDPPSWTSGSNVVQDDEADRQSAAQANDPTRDRSSATRVAERNRSRSKNAPERSQREQPSRADRTPEQRNADGQGPGQRFEDLDEQVLAEQDKPHLKLEDTDDRTDLPGRRTATEGPHQAFPGTRSGNSTIGRH